MISSIAFDSLSFGEVLSDAPLAIMAVSCWLSRACDKSLSTLSGDEEGIVVTGVSLLAFVLVSTSAIELQVNFMLLTSSVDWFE